MTGFKKGAFGIDFVACVVLGVSSSAGCFAREGDVVVSQVHMPMEMRPMEPIRIEPMTPMEPIRIEPSITPAEPIRVEPMAEPIRMGPVTIDRPVTIDTQNSSTSTMKRSGGSGPPPPRAIAPPRMFVSCLQSSDADSRCRRILGRQMAVDLAAITMIEMPDLSKAAVFLEDHKLPEAIAEFRAHTGSFWFWNRARARYAARAKELTEIIKQYEERGNSGSVMNG